MVGDDRSTATSRTRTHATRFPAEPLAEELEGTRMLYSSGTTGRPKGVKYKITRQRVGDQPAEMGMMTAVWGMDERRRLPVARAAVPLGAAVLFA